MIIVDENERRLLPALEKAGLNPSTVTPGTNDDVIRAALEAKDDFLFITNNPRGFRGLRGVIRTSQTVPLDQVTNVTLDSVGKVLDNPAILDAFPQLPASGLNKGLMKKVKK